jgi:hypothetical protein
MESLKVPEGVESSRQEKKGVTYTAGWKAGQALGERGGGESPDGENESVLHLRDRDARSVETVTWVR